MEHTFSVDMKSKKYVKNISISDEARDRVLFEGNLGKLHELTLTDDVLEFIGANGVLRVGLTENQLHKALRKASQIQPKLRGGDPHNQRISKPSVNRLEAGNRLSIGEWVKET